MITFLYIVFCLFCTASCCLATKICDKEDVTVGLLIIYLLMGAMPIVNVVCAGGAWLSVASATKFWSKKLF